MIDMWQLKLGLNYPDNIWGPGQDLGACAPWTQRRTATGLKVKG